MILTGHLIGFSFSHVNKVRDYGACHFKSESSGGFFGINRAAVSSSSDVMPQPTERQSREVLSQQHSDNIL